MESNPDGDWCAEGRGKASSGAGISRCVQSKHVIMKNNFKVGLT
jgi:hypothetical protein